MRRGLQIIVKDLAFITIEHDAEKSETHLKDLQKELKSLEENAKWLSENYNGDAELIKAFAENITTAAAMQQEVINLSAELSLVVICTQA